MCWAPTAGVDGHQLQRPLLGLRPSSVVMPADMLGSPGAGFYPMVETGGHGVLVQKLLGQARQIAEKVLRRSA